MTDYRPAPYPIVAGLTTFLLCLWFIEAGMRPLYASLASIVLGVAFGSTCLWLYYRAEVRKIDRHYRGE